MRALLDCRHPVDVSSVYKPMPTPVGEENLHHLYLWMTLFTDKIEAYLKKIKFWDTACVKATRF